MFKKLWILGPAFMFALSAPVMAGEAETIKALQAKFPGLSSEEIKPGPFDGVYEVAIESQVLYVSGDGRYLLKGDIIDLDTNVNLTDLRRNTARGKVMAAVDRKDMIVFAPENVQHTITVFTDIDCGYCRKLHREMDELNELGVKVQYLFFPRTGPGSASWYKAENVWCSADRNAALTAAKNGAEIEAGAACENNPVASGYQLGQKIGLRGTPAIVTEDGELIAGYLPAKQLVSRLESQKRLQAASSN